MRATGGRVSPESAGEIAADPLQFLNYGKAIVSVFHVHVDRKDFPPLRVWVAHWHSNVAVGMREPIGVNFCRIEVGPLCPSNAGRFAVREDRKYRLPPQCVSVGRVAFARRAHRLDFPEKNRGRTGDGLMSVGVLVERRDLSGGQAVVEVREAALGTLDSVGVRVRQSGP